MPETEVVDSPEAPESISALPDVDTSIETQESAASETTEEPPAESRSWSLDEWKEHPEFSEWYEDHSRELQLSGQKREYGRTQETVKQIRTDILGKIGDVTQGLNSFHSLAIKAIEMDGAEGFAAALAKYPEILEKYKEAATLSSTLKDRTQGFDRDALVDDVVMYNIGNAMLVAAEAIGDKDMAEPFIKRFGDEYRFDERKGAVAYEKFIKAIFKKGEEAGYKRGLGAGKDVASEVQRGAERSGKAPPTVAGTPARANDIKSAEASYANGEISEAEARRRGVKF